MQSARLATRSLDVQTYIWHADLTGAYLGQVLLECRRPRRARAPAARRPRRARQERRLRGAGGASRTSKCACSTPGSRARGRWPRRARAPSASSASTGGCTTRAGSPTTAIAVVGGRNVGDEYFGAGEEMNFVDLDFAMLGPVVRDVSATFDRYWNSPSAYPMEVLDPDGVNEAALDRLRKALGGARRRCEGEPLRRSRSQGDDLVRQMIAGDWPVQWSSKYQFVSDDPAKVTMKKRDVKRTHVGVALAPMVQAARERVAVISPYFVPGEEVTASFTRMAGGREIGPRPDQFARRERRRRRARRLLALPQAAAQGRGAALGTEAGGRATATRACSARPARACTPRPSPSTARSSSSAATTSTRAPPGSTASRACWSRDAVLARQLEALFEMQIGGRARLAREPRGRRLALERRPGNPSTRTPRPRPGSGSRPGRRACCTSTRSSDAKGTRTFIFEANMKVRVPFRSGR